MHLIPGRFTMTGVYAAVAIWFAVGTTSAQQEAPRIELAPGDTVSLSFFARPDISGTVRVRGDGTIAIHQIGDVEAAAMTEAELQAALRERAFEVFGTQTSVIVEAVGLRPVYVIGDVAAPGAYDFRPGLTALQAFALAGGAPTAADDTGLMLRLEAERQNVVMGRVRLEQIEEELERLRAEQASLAGAEAEDGELDELNTALLGLREAVLAIQTERNETSRELALAEGALLEERLSLLDEQGRLLQTALARALELQERGLASADRVESSEQSLSALQTSVLDAQSDAASNQRLAASLGFENEHLRLQEQLDIHQRLLENEREAVIIAAQLLASETFLRRFGAAVPAADGSAAAEILRRFAVTRSVDGGGNETHGIDASAYLLPGDIVQVIAAPLSE
ncbi:MAG: polysaccharide biosynthesis/export family protein [Halieaceae bacterium]|jgi:protein involved in polysaccharide export with SLBB domain|nr:polysaccharide biosynthesis/export family protein [Halieaceae bacterium]